MYVSQLYSVSSDQSHDSVPSFSVSWIHDYAAVFCQSSYVCLHCISGITSLFVSVVISISVPAHQTHSPQALHIGQGLLPSTIHTTPSTTLTINLRGHQSTAKLQHTLQLLPQLNHTAMIHTHTHLCSLYSSSTHSYAVYCSLVPLTLSLACCSRAILSSSFSTLSAVPSCPWYLICVIII